MKKKKSFSMTTKYVILFGALLLLTNIILGLVLMKQSSENIQALVRKSMLNISNTAAGLLDGDALGALTEEDVDGPVFNAIKEQLTVFQENVDIEFIYAVKQDEGDHFVFTVDPDPVDPGAFGEDVLVTEALVQAAKGISAVDKTPMEDRWGDFYSSYSPVFDSNGTVAGIIGVDFNSEWYDKQVREHTFSITVISLFSMLAGGVLVLIFTQSIRKRLQEISRELSVLSSDVDKLAEEIGSNAGYERLMFLETPKKEFCEKKQDSNDEMEALSQKIHVMHGEMKQYLDYIQAKAYTDGLTGVGNTSAYLEVQQELEQKIQQKTALFSIAVFDINYLKNVNDDYGHAVGDRVIINASTLITKTFGVGRTFRIGGDEFLALAEGVGEEEIQEMLLYFESHLNAFREKHEEPEKSLSISWGATAYLPEVDQTFRDVFIRADEIMYQNKREFHKAHKNTGRA